VSGGAFFVAPLPSPLLRRGSEGGVGVLKCFYTFT